MLFKKKVLSSSIALALVGSAMPALAQDDGLEIEEVIVEGGIRASLKKSMDLKRDSAGVADAISAEDMGKFPDTNLAEALQRVTGVSIDRQRGEGSKVTVRGFGPDYNLVTLNGRQMPTHSGDSRSFDFGNLASEGISAVVVHKTGQADAPSGGIGSLINIITTKPLEAGSIATFGVKAGIDTSTETGDTATPEVSGLFSETFADDTVGVALSFSSQERHNAVNYAQIDGWYTVEADGEAFGKTVPGPTDKTDAEGEPLFSSQELADQVNRPTAAGENLSIPQNLTYILDEYVSERINGQLTLQWRPVDSLTATVDYTYSELDLERRYNNLSSWFEQGARTQSSEWDEGPVSSPLMYSELREDGKNSDFPMGIGRDGSINENKSVGLNLEWNVSDSLQLTLDYHNSSAKTGANNPYGTSSLITISSMNRVVTTLHLDQDLPVLELGLNSADPRTVSDGGTPRPLYKDDMVITGSVFVSGLSRMDIEQTKLGGTYDLSDVTSIDFGVELAEVSNRSASRAILRQSWTGTSVLTEPGDISHVLTRASMADSFDQITGGDDSRRQTEFFTATLEDLIEIAEMKAGLSSDTGVWPDAQNIGDCGTPYCRFTGKGLSQELSGLNKDKDADSAIGTYGTWDYDKYTTEETVAAYAQLTHDAEINGMPLNLRAGLRYEETEVVSAALAQTYDRIYWEGGNDYTIQPAVDDEGNPVLALEDFEGNYNLFLPNLDINLEITDELVARASISKTITRGNYDKIQGGVTINGSTYKLGTTPLADGGNPGLLPIEAENFDLSLEWYYGDADYLSVGYYQKTVENFISDDFRSDELYNLRDPAAGGLYAQVAEDEGIELYKYDEVGAAINNLGVDPDGEAGFDADGKLYGTNANELVTFQVKGPVNEKTAKVDGLEVNWQHNFGETGYGFIANVTIANANVAYDPVAWAETVTDPDTGLETKIPVDQFALSGLSDSANLIGYYDKDGLNVRVAYNWRDDFFNGMGQAEGTREINPTQIEAFGQVDISASYEINDNLIIFMDGINITESPFRSYGREKAQVLQSGQTGARYNLGARYTF